MIFRRIAIYSLIFILLVIAVSYCFKSSIVNYLVGKKIEKYQKKYGFSIAINGLRIHGLRIITISEVSFTFPDDTFLLEAKSFEAKLALPELVRLRINPLFLGFDSLSMQVSQKLLSRYPNAIELDSTIQVVTQSMNKPLNVGFTSRLLRALMGISTSEIEFKNINLNYLNDNGLITISSPMIRNHKGDFFARFHVNENGKNSVFHIWGNSSKSESRISMKILGDDFHPFHLPIAQAKYDLNLQFDSLTFSFNGENLSSDSLYFTGFSRVNGLKVLHPKLSESEVFIDSGSVKFFVGANETHVKLDSATSLTFNRFKLPLQLEIEKKGSPKIQFTASTGVVNASELFESLPAGLFSTLQGIKVKGDISFEMRAKIDFALPDSLDFSAKLSPFNFTIQSFGDVDFSRINDSLIHTIYVNDSTNKYILLMPDNKYFRPSERISPHLKNAVVTAEDGGFYGHKGFDPEGFRYALAQNIKQKRMARGGSTITMQLVKNLYLNHSKNLVRKAEEALIVWLIESQRIVEKDRLLEIYLNIIEWGPCINGIAEAAEFYFEKEPHELELNEAIFLASIVPKPNHFMYNFDEDFNLKPFMADYYSFIAGKMHERGTITDEERENLIPNVELKGKALEYILEQLHDNPMDTLNVLIDY